MRFIPVKFQNRIALKLEIKGTKKCEFAILSLI
jgi:hypothetical protein